MKTIVVTVSVGSIADGRLILSAAPDGEGENEKQIKVAALEQNDEL